MWETGDMPKWTARLVLLSVLAASELSGQSALTTPDIPGIAAGGTPVILVKAGLNSAEGPIAAPDGSLYFTGPSDTTRFSLQFAKRAHCSSSASVMNELNHCRS